MEEKEKIDYSRKHLDTTNISTTARQVYTEFVKYKNKHKLAKNNQVKRGDFEKIYKQMFITLEQQIEESKGGVMIKKFGYFFVWKSSKRKKSYFINENGVRIGYYNRHFKGYKYKIVFLPIKGTNGLTFFSMAGKINKALRKRILKRIKGGVIYKNYAYSLSAHLNR